ncbi:hypothetical protein [Paraliomyxa miuraensis]|uniref:hypothetical protein n=1 Tax=Paraliomyxa miuraensis TaxID=376150 RepID=UPI00225465A0|nr:hypothetical protein [Paraliomyxa miuraensis]MCX4241787.1 hypothetical protein [Paraliomyxa miuraensis]
MTIAYRAPSHPGMGYPAFVDPQPPGRPPPRVRAPADGEPSEPRSPDPTVFPRLDEDLVRPETREEMLRGHLVLAMPAKEPHAERHHALDYVTHGVVAPGYVGATDLLTRASTTSHFATDTCIRREGIDPATGTRHLEELAFEIVNEQSLSDITERAQDLSARGVRRIIAIFVKTNEIREWSPERNDWITLDPDGTFEDRTLVQPIPVRALLDNAAANRAVVRALHAKQDPAILEIEEAGVEKGRAQMARTAIEALCNALRIPLDAERRATMQSLDVAGLQAMLVALGTERRWP